MKDWKGLATGIGSLPYTDADEAVEAVWKYAPHIPFWPQLPKRDFREGMTIQYSEGLPCIKVSEKDLVFDPTQRDEELEKFYAKIIENDREHFALSRHLAQGLYAFHKKLASSDLAQVEAIKCHVTGPFTVAAGIKDDKGVPLLHDPVFMQVIIQCLTMKALWQIDFFKKFNKKMIVFIDEPYLGCFGSAYTPINREDVIKGLSELTAPLKQEGAYTGVHCCGNTDWSIFTDISTMDIINFDAFNYLDKIVLYAGNISAFLNRGGILCWGIVPTQELSDSVTVSSLEQKIMDGIDRLAKKKVNSSAVRTNLLISPSCGLGSMPCAETHKILELLSETSLSLRKKL